MLDIGFSFLSIETKIKIISYHRGVEGTINIVWSYFFSLSFFPMLYAPAISGPNFQEW